MPLTASLKKSLFQAAREVASFFVSSARVSAGGGSGTGHRGSRGTSVGGRHIAPLVLLGLLGSASFSAQAGDFCSEAPYYGVIDGDVLGDSPKQITIDTDCIFQNWPQSNPLATKINYQTNDPSIYLIIFDNVWLDPAAHLACSNIPHKLWVVNSDKASFDGTCQDIMIPAEMIEKTAPSAMAEIGVPFTYTLTLPSMNYPAGDPSPNELYNAILWDDLTATGADLTFVSINAYYKGSGAPVNLVPEDKPMAPDPTQYDPALYSKCGVWTTKNLCYKPIPVISPGEQIVVQITVVPDDSSRNVGGTVFTNTAQWWFGREIDINGDGTITPDEMFTPLPGESGVSQSMTIVEPNLVVSKTGPDTANLGEWLNFTIDVENRQTGSASDAWDVTILDQLPNDATGGMCDLTPRVQSVTLAGTPLKEGTDYTLSYVGCNLTVNLLEAAGPISPTEHLIINYRTKLDARTKNGAALRNVAGATLWYSDDSTNTDRRTYTHVLTDGTVGTDDYQDAHTVAAVLAYYWFEKTVENLSSGQNPATWAATGDTLRYTLRLQSVGGMSDFSFHDDLGAWNTASPAFEPGSLSVVTSSLPAGASDNSDANGGTGGMGLLDVSGLNVAANGEVQIQFDVKVDSGITDSYLIANQSELVASNGVPFAVSDDPTVDGQADPTVPGDEQPTQVMYQAPVPPTAPLKEALQPTATIGDQFVYRITIPGQQSTSDLFDVKIKDNLAASGADLQYVGAQVSSTSASSWTGNLVNSGSATDLLIENTDSGGIDIPAGEQLTIDVTVELRNTPTNVRTHTFSNVASYTYNESDNDIATVQTIGDSLPTGMTVVEPVLTATKTVSNVTAGKIPTDPAVGGDTLEYLVTVTNGGDAEAYDVNVVDKLPSEVLLDTTSATAQFNGADVSGFVASPGPLADGSVVWGWDNGDPTLDIPAGQVLELRYRVTVTEATGAAIANSVRVDWTSQDGDVYERTGVGCPTTTDPDNYCFTGASATQQTLDTNKIVKSVNADSWDLNDGVVRVGDTVDYKLELTLREGTTYGVRVGDALPPGLAFDSVVSINGIAGPSFTAVSPFTHADFAGPSIFVDATNGTSTVTWDFGDIDNAVNNDTTDDTFVIIYRARVQEGILTQAPTTTLTNTATLSYTNASGTPATFDSTRMQYSADIEVRQPVLDSITKSDRSGRTGTLGTPLLVDVAADVMNFRLESCNTTGQAPAYGVLVSDDLPMHLDETSISGPANGAGQPDVYVGGTLLTPVTDYTYTAPARDGTMEFRLNTPVNPTQCVTVDYDIRFHTDFGPNLKWNNSATVSEYWSLSPQAGQQYGLVGPAEFWMTNQATIDPPTKTLTSAAKATIGEQVTYKIKVPTTPANAALYDVKVTDVLDPVNGSLEYVSATDISVNGLAIDDSGTDRTVFPNQVNLVIAQIPAGQQAIIQLTARVANNTAANAGVSFQNSASYTYATSPTGGAINGGSASTTNALTIVEPLVTVNKPQPTLPTPPTAGDIIPYTVELKAESGTFTAPAYDVVLTDELGPGLQYVAGSTKIDGVAAADPAISGQILTWMAIDSITEGTTVTVTYNVKVLDTVAIRDDLTNLATARWTSLAADASPDERTGQQDFTYNDYVASDSTSLTVQDSTTLNKRVAADSYIDATSTANDGTVRIGDTVDYELKLGLQEGSHTGLVLNDTLPAGMEYVGMVSADFFGSAGTATPSQNGQQLTWNLGNVVNPADGDTTNDFITIVYRARVLNGGVVTQSTLTNSATLDYSVAGSPAPQLTANVNVTVLQPNLGVTKSAVTSINTPTNGATVVEAGETVTYTVDLTNSGTGPAYDPYLVDIIPEGLRQGGVTTTSITLVNAGTSITLTPTYDSGSGKVVWDFDSVAAATIPADDTLRVVYEVTGDPDLGAGLTLTNTAEVSNYYSFDNNAVPVNSQPDWREVYGPASDSFDLTTLTPGAPLKENPATSPTIGQEFTYTITVPAAPQPVALHDVKIYDDLRATAMGAQVTLVGITRIDGTQPWTPVNTSGDPTNLVIADTTTGIEIPANEQIKIGVTVRLDNVASNAAGTTTFQNSASYTYNQVDGDDTTQQNGGSSTTGNLSVVEPALSIGKTVINATPGKTSTAPIAGGDILQYTVTITNSGGSTAFDTNVVDTLPPELLFYSGFTPTATINNSPVGFVAVPAGAPSGPLVWGRDNGGDGSMDIPADGTLVLVYQAQVQVSTASTFTNEAWVDWTSLDGTSSYERTGAGCPTTTASNQYCAGPAQQQSSVTDNNSLTKTAVQDDYGAANDKTLGIGNTVTYRLEVNLGEGLTENVQVADALPAGMEFESLVGITPATGAGSFTYNPISVPSQGDTNLLWNLGNVTNAPSNDGTPVDTLTIEFVARVVPDPAIPHAPSTTLPNSATLSYTGSDLVADPSVLTGSDTVTIVQPMMDPPVKRGNGSINTSTTALPVNVATDTVHFQVEACNAGQAPAYGIVLTDTLESQLDEASVSPPVVTINGGTVLTAGVDYSYTPPPARGGSLTIRLSDSTAVNPSQCVTADYDVGFHTDFGPNQTWSNKVTLDEYWSMAAPARQQYPGPSAYAQFFMTNPVTVTPLTKTLVSGPEATIGQEVDYEITVPGDTVNAALDNVVVTDVLPAALAYVDASAVDLNGNPVTLTKSENSGTVTLTVDHIPANQKAVITLRTRVANNADANNDGTGITNSASYTYTGIPVGSVTKGTSGPVRVIEPLVTVNKSVSNTSPTAGDVLTYTLTFDAAGSGAAGDNYSGAFDLTIEDSLDPGLLYVPGSAKVDGVGLVDPADNGANGVDAGQTLTWNLAGGADIDIPESGQVTVTYNVQVLDNVGPGQQLSNSVVGRWTSLNGAQDLIERNGSGAPAYNDYFTAPFTTTVTTEVPTLVVEKTVTNLTSGQDPGRDAQPGDKLGYTVRVTNTSAFKLSSFSIIDELDALNASPMFVPGSLEIVSISASGADTSNTNGAGGAKGTGRLEVSGLSLDAAGGANDSVEIRFNATLAAVITSGTDVLNQAGIFAGGVFLANSDDPTINGADDPAVSGDEDPTPTHISSAPAFEVNKSSQDITDDPALLLAGETLHYTITVRNTGNEDAVSTLLRDQIPANTTYVAGSTTLNGAPVTDPSTGVSPLRDGLLINAPADTTTGAMPADVPTSANNVATITFDVVVSSTAVNGTQISNQAFVSANGAGTSGAVDPQQSDDPATPDLADDPTIDVVGSVPRVDAMKTVELVSDLNSNGNVDSFDTLRYTITITNVGSVPATGVTFTDAVPNYTTYVSGSTRLNGATVADPSGGGSPLTAGIDVSSSDLAAPTAGNGTLSTDGTAVVTFEVTVNDLSAVTPLPTVISNQGTVSTNTQDELTDADGIDSNGDQVTDIALGAAQLLAITKDVIPVDGAAEPGSTLEYRIRVTNIGTEAATQVQITDSIDTNYLTYVDGALDGVAANVNYTAPVVTADYTAAGGLAPGQSTTLIFHADIGASVPIGTLISNTANVSWNNATQNAQASASIKVGGVPGEGAISGRAWNDANYSRQFDSGDTILRGWTVELYQNGQVAGTQTTDDNGLFTFTGLQPNDPAVDPYQLRFRAPNAGSTTAVMGFGDSDFVDGHIGDLRFTDGPQQISDIGISSGDILQNLNLPAQPNGVVYDSVQRTPISGATLTMVNADTGSTLPAACFQDPAQQGQVTSASGFYRFDLNFGGSQECQSGDNYLIVVEVPASGYVSGPSQIIPPSSIINTTPFADTAPFSVPGCAGGSTDAVPATADLCEAQPSASAPSLDIRARTTGTNYYLYLTLADGQSPVESALFNNHIPLDPVLDDTVNITKTSSVVNVSRGDLVPYTITFNNSLDILLQDISVVDTFPAGFKYVSGSARFDGKKVEPVASGRELRWDNLDLAAGDQHTIKLLFRVGAGVSEAEYVNRAQVVNSLSGEAVSNVATATVRVVPDPTLDCTDVIGKVFDDANRNGYQDEGEKGLAGARVVTARGLVATADEYGRFHITCAVVPNQDRGSNFILKLDDRSLPSGYRVTTENPRVLRATRGKVLKFNFGAAIHRVVRLDIADGVFKPDSTEIRLQWLPRFDLLMEQLQKEPSTLRISYLADVEDEGLVDDRIDAVKEKIQQTWEKVNCCQELMIETEIFWRRGAPPDDLL